MPVVQEEKNPETQVRLEFIYMVEGEQVRVATLDPDAQIIRYLLDEMEPEERSALEERFSQEPSLVEQVSSMEDDLIMQYVCSSLEERLVPRFEEVYLQAPARRARIDSARILRQALDAAASAKEQRQPHPALRLRWGFVLAFAAAMVFLVAGLRLLWKSTPSRPITTSVDNQQIAFVLEPGRVRSDSGIQITVPGTTREVQLKLMWPSSMANENYRVTLGTPERPEVWSGATVHQNAGVVATVPANVLTAGDYTLKLEVARAGTHWEDVANYYFRVAKPIASGK